MKQIVKYSTVAMTAAILIACGGSNSSSNNATDNNNDGQTPQTAKNMGVFLDSAIENISYKTATQSGNTNAQGEFGYNDGEKVTFSIGNVTFPEIAAKNLLTPLDVFNTTDVSDLKVINAIRLLQSLDKDANPDNGIQITDTAKIAATKALDFDLSETDFASNADVLNLVQKAGQDTPVDALISKQAAVEHFEGTLKDNDISYGDNAAQTFSKSDITGKPLYFVFKDTESCGTDYVVETFNFNDDNSYTLTSCKGDTETAQYEITDSGVIKLTYNNGSGTENEYITLATRDSSAADWEVCYTEQPVTATDMASCGGDYNYVFFTKTKADEYANKQNGTDGSTSNSLAFTATELQGKSWYFVVDDSNCNPKYYAEEFKFDTAGKYSEFDCNGNASATGTYSIQKNGEVQITFTENGTTTTEFIKRTAKTSDTGDFKICFYSDNNACGNENVFLSKSAAQTEVNRLNSAQ